MVDRFSEKMAGTNGSIGTENETESTVTVRINKKRILTIWVPITILASTLIAAYIAGFYNLILITNPKIFEFFTVFMITFPFFIAIIFLFLGTSRLVFMKCPLIVINENEVLLPSVNLRTNITEISSFKNEAFVQSTGTRLKLQFKTSDPRRLKANLLFPAVFATTRSYKFFILGMSGRVAENYKILTEHLQKLEIQRT